MVGSEPDRSLCRQCEVAMARRGNFKYILDEGSGEAVLF